ncbi:TonB-dependent siderophore receptor [Sphingomonas morindae]|uniref:TonB-dependent siderophore receptor n=1 Tax=Sphingomonas morindae TaxID=1541170 RepID=A0ABY4X6Y8_9SPHN|nr:TonB-dependent siderophore receptor [Sphingomonas morindae]USI72670.1 TonB-dependent siderophore receptor [Sphingomonas morindae]
MTMQVLRGAMALGGLLIGAPALAEGAAPEDGGVIVVTGQQDATQTSAGTKSAMPIAEVPQSISVIDAGTIVGLGLQNLNQALRFVAGVTPEQRGASAEVYDQFKLRGFDALQYLDGLRSFDSPSGYAAAQVDVSRLDRVEVVKGPASALYGQTGPGGLVALSSKLPLDRGFYGAVGATYGTYDLYRIDADMGGQAAPSVLWRLYGSANGAHTQQSHGRRARQTVSGAVTLGQTSRTTLTLLATYSHDPRNGTYGVFPASGTFIANPNGRLPTRFDDGEPGNFFSREQAAGTFILAHDFGGGWHFRSAGRYQYVGSRLGIVYTSGSLADDPSQRVFNRASYATRERLNAWTFDNQLAGSVTTGPVTHALLFGVDRQVLHSTETYAFGTATPIDGFAPVYGSMTVPRTPQTVPGGEPGYLGYHVRQQGLYAQDEMAAGGLRLTLSGRQDWARVAPAGAPAEHSDKFTYRAGLLYKTGFGLAPYISYATSFQPQSGQVRTSDGSLGNAKPSAGKQLEAGAKYLVPGTQILLTAAWFRIHQTNLLTAVPNTNYSIQNARVRSKGVEVEATAPLPYGFEARLAFSRQSVRNSDGSRILGVGRGGTSANLEWAPKTGPAAGLAIGGAVRHVDQVYAGTYFDGITRNTPGVTLFDALARYDLGKLSPRLDGLSLALNATNLFDKKYLTTCYLDYGWCWYGNRRTVQGTIGFRW